MIWMPIIWVCATHAMYPRPGHFPARLWVLRAASFPIGLTAACLFAGGKGVKGGLGVYVEQAL
jgi:hypothetical protein